MEHTDLTDEQYQVLSKLAEAPIPLDATALGKQLPLIEKARLRLVLNRLTTSNLVDRTDTPKGYIYEVAEASQALFNQRARDALDGKLMRLNKPTPEAVAQSIATATADETLSDVLADLPMLVPVSAAPADIATAAPDSPLDRLLAELSQPQPVRPSDLDGLLVDLQRLIDGLMPRFPDVAKGLGKIHMYVDDAYPAAK